MRPKYGSTQADRKTWHRARMAQRRAKYLTIAERVAARVIPREIERAIMKHHRQTREMARRVRQMER